MPAPLCDEDMEELLIHDVLSQDEGSNALPCLYDVVLDWNPLEVDITTGLAGCSCREWNY